MSSISLQEGLRHATAANAKASREALRIVKDVLKESLCPNGLTTAEIFKLASRKPPPPLFKPANAAVGQPPHPDHPVKSTRYLKKTILPILEGNGVIRMKRVTRTSDASPSPSSTSSLSRQLFAWIPVDPNTLPKPKIPEPPKEPVGSAVGIGQDWLHLNKRRRRARVEKVAKDYEKMKEVLRRREAGNILHSKTLNS